MSNILLVEPDYRSKFPPLGLLRISSFHKENGDSVSFIRGKNLNFKESYWDRIYIASLYTYELPRTVSTIKYYLSSVSNPNKIYVGGIGATLIPDYIKNRIKCTVIEGQLDQPKILGQENLKPIAEYVPDYSIIDNGSWHYKPTDAYFCRVSKGCIRKCNFCAVPILEPNFGFSQSIESQIKNVNERFGERQNIVLLDNNLLALQKLDQIIGEIRYAGFSRGATRLSRKRIVDFNQGIDARLINNKIARKLYSICLQPVRLAFDYDAMEKPYLKAIYHLVKVGFNSFTNYVMYNYEDTPLSLYNRLRINVELSSKMGVRITGFPMKYIPINNIDRKYISKGWRWRYLRGMQCILLATHGLTSPNLDFFNAAFGKSYEEFLEILSMPDQYIIHRNRYKNNEAHEWQKKFKKLSQSDREEFINLLEIVHRSVNRQALITSNGKFRSLLEHYYPNGQIPQRQAS